MSEHLASVINDYRAAFSWAARCSCGWEELHSLAVAADRAVEQHVKSMMIKRAEMIPASIFCRRCGGGVEDHPWWAERCQTCGEPVPCPEDDGPPVHTGEGWWHADCSNRPFGGGA